MDVYLIRHGAGWDMYCQECMIDFINNGGNPNDVDGPHSNGGGGEADTICHCNQGYKCIKAMKTSQIPVGTIHCKSCKDTGIIMLFNSSVECTDCTKSEERYL